MSNEVSVKHAQEPLAQTEQTRGEHYFRPNVDILEKDHELLLLADMPGARSDQIDVRFEDGELTIHGPAEPRLPADAVPVLREYGVGDFYRTFRVSEWIDATKIHAEYEAGVLVLHLPKVEAAKPRKITVNAN